jgi:hypothetical protein
MTMFWGVSGSDVCDWDTKASATDQRFREPPASDWLSRCGMKGIEARAAQRSSGGGHSTAGAVNPTERLPTSANRRTERSLARLGGSLE